MTSCVPNRKPAFSGATTPEAWANRKPANPATAGQRHRQQDLDALRADPEIGAAQVVVAHGDEQLAGVRADEDPGRQGRRDEHESGQPEEALKLERQRVISDEPAARPGQRAAGIDELRDRRSETPARSPKRRAASTRDRRRASRPASPRTIGRKMASASAAAIQAGVEPKARHRHRGRIGADAEECGLAEGQDAR